MQHRRTIDGSSITATGFERLLKQLDADGDRAAAEYDQLRLALVRFFDWRGAWEPDECADETLNRLAHKLQGDTVVDDVRRYAYGVARLVLLECLRRQAQAPATDVSSLADLSQPPPTETNELRECFERCLATLPRESRALVIDYYQEQGRKKAEHRQRLAQTAGISDAALRSRVQRIRDRLEHCVRQCATTAPAPPGNQPGRRESRVSDTQDMKDR